MKRKQAKDIEPGDILFLDSGLRIGQVLSGPRCYPWSPYLFFRVDGPEELGAMYPTAEILVQEWHVSRD